jgi:hypothetical protein
MKTPFALLSLLVLVAAGPHSGAESAESTPAGPALELSPELRALFQSEMRELLSGTQVIAASLPTGNWEAIAKTAAAMRDSYVFARKLTQAQEQELARLPAEFRALDAGFHARTGKLLDAAQAGDAEAVSFQFSRLLDTCVACHASFAKAQFPQLGTVANEPHHP